MANVVAMRRLRSGTIGAMEHLLIIGCGDIARRALPALLARYRVTALVRTSHEAARLAGLGVETVLGDLDDPPSLAPLSGSADRIACLAPPPDAGATDPRTRNLLATLRATDSKSGAILAHAPRAPRHCVYVSTSGVYGHRAGAFVDESHAPIPVTDRARRRLDAERAWLEFGRATGATIVVLRVPGIYAADRLPLDRIRRGTPVLRDEDDVYTNHIHADDLAAIVVTAIERDDKPGIYNASDDTQMKMGEWFDLLADRSALPRPPRIPRAGADTRIPPALLSFMSESRRLVNAKIKRELGVKLRYPSVREGVPPRIEEK